MKILGIMVDDPARRTRSHQTIIKSGLTLRSCLRWSRWIESDRLRRRRGLHIQMKGVPRQFLFKGTESWAKCNEIVMTCRKNWWKFIVASMSGKSRKLIADHPWMHEESIKILQVEDTGDSKTFLAHIFDWWWKHARVKRAQRRSAKDKRPKLSLQLPLQARREWHNIVKIMKGRTSNQEYSTQQDSHSDLMEKSKAFQTKQKLSKFSTTNQLYDKW